MPRHEHGTWPSALHYGCAGAGRSRTLRPGHAVRQFVSHPIRLGYRKRVNVIMLDGTVTTPSIMLRLVLWNRINWAHDHRLVHQGRLKARSGECRPKQHEEHQWFQFPTDAGYSRSRWACSLRLRLDHLSRHKGAAPTPIRVRRAAALASCAAAANRDRMADG